MWEIIERDRVWSMQQKCGGQEGVLEAEVCTDLSGSEIVGDKQYARVPVQGDLGWRNLEERRQEMKVLFDNRLEGMEGSRLVKMVEKLREDGGIEWWEEYDVLDNKGG